jgi:hypothetical protein
LAEFGFVGFEVGVGHCLRGVVGVAGVATTPTAAGATGMLRTLRTSNGQQVSYNGHFLYTFVEDGPGRSLPGRLTGGSQRSVVAFVHGVRAPPRGAIANP